MSGDAKAVEDYHKKMSVVKEKVCTQKNLTSLFKLEENPTLPRQCIQYLFVLHSFTPFFHTLSYRGIVDDFWVLDELCIPLSAGSINSYFHIGFQCVYSFCCTVDVNKFGK